jgi:hypothetical protein
VGDSDGGTLVGFTPEPVLSLQPIVVDGGNPAMFTQGMTGRPTAAFERDRTITVAFDDRRVVVWQQGQSDYISTTTQTLSFVTTALGLYPRGDGGLAVAAYGELDGGLAGASFTPGGAVADDTTFVDCSLGPLPQRVLPAPDASVRVVVGTAPASCNSPLSDPGRGFVGRFGTSGNSGLRFNSSAGPMALGLVEGSLWLAWRSDPVGYADLATVPSTGTALVGPHHILQGPAITPVEIVEVPGEGRYLVGSARNSLTEGGVLFTLADSDVFIAHLTSGQTVDRLEVLVDNGDQDVVGAIVLGGQLVVAGNCTGGRLCPSDGGSGAWVAGFTR